MYMRLPAWCADDDACVIGLHVDTRYVRMLRHDHDDGDRLGFVLLERLTLARLASFLGGVPGVDCDAVAFCRNRASNPTARI